MSGVFVTFEGGEGAGKSTQIALLSERLRSDGVPVVTTREPGGTGLGEGVRELLLHADHPVDAWAELLLYEASRAQLVAEVIAPALELDALVLCDRFTDSTTAYQGYGRGLPLDRVAEANRLGSRGMTPALTVLLDVDPALGLARATGGGADRLEREALAFHERVREGFRALASAEPGRFVVVDGGAPAHEVAAAVWEAVTAHQALAGVLH